MYVCIWKRVRLPVSGSQTFFLFCLFLSFPEVRQGLRVDKVVVDKKLCADAYLPVSGIRPFSHIPGHDFRNRLICYV